MKAISCRVDPATHRRVMALSRATGQSAANIVRQAVLAGILSVEANLRPLIEQRRQILDR